jgi:putative membrane protein
MTTNQPLAIGSAATIAVNAATAQAQVQSSDVNSRKFITEAIQSDLSEITLGRMAEKNAGSDGVRSFAQTLVQDHTEAMRQTKQIAQEIGAKPPETPSKKAKKEARELTDVSGASFDKEFLRYMIKDHKQEIKKFETEANGRSGPASDLAKQQLPTLRKHLQIAQSLRGKISSTR